ncbi:unnamed protein product [Leptosia nina]|uniref:Uncharacterized protein n=1 Tax=Leptosia nina TaxID=320188 RepID=A0AAV1JQH9_9NEOP
MTDIAISVDPPRGLGTSLFWSSESCNSRCRVIAGTCRKIYTRCILNQTAPILALAYSLHQLKILSHFIWDALVYRSSSKKLPTIINLCRLAHTLESLDAMLLVRQQGAQF